MAKVLVSFIGRGEKAHKRGLPETATGYETARYQFPDEKQPGEPTPLFGAALLRYLQNSTGSADRWMVMGTQGSSWATLVAVVGPDVPEELKAAHKNIDLWTRDSTIQNEQLASWQQGLQNHLKMTQCMFCITGSADGAESQQKMWQALLDAVQPGDEVILDVTHGFRHMPVLASFMLSALRWVRNLKKVDLYYGAYEMAEEGEAVKVLHLPLVNELMKVAEAAATYEHTGNYKQILNLLGFEKDLEAEAVVYADELNQQATKEAKSLAEKVEKKDDKPIAASLKPQAQEALKWAAEEGIARQMGRKAMRACENEQYSNAIALLFEAIRIAFAEDSPTTTAVEHDKREKAWEDFYENKATQPQQSCLDNVKKLRHAVMHGLSGKSTQVNAALDKPEKFRDIVEKGYKFLDSYLKSKGK